MHSNSSLRQEWAVELQCRIGITTGSVVVGADTERQRLATGDAVNVAARLQTAAGGGQILVDLATRRLLENEWQMGEGRPLQLRGRTEAVQAYVLDGLDTSQPPATRRPLVGRAAELGHLSAALNRVRGSATAELVLIAADAGLGKSRLVEEFQLQAGAEAGFTTGRCLAYGADITFWPIAEIVRQTLGEGTGDDADTVRDSLMRILGTGDAADVDRLLGVLGLADPAGVLEETYVAVRRLFTALAARRPLVLVVEDLHWAEPALVGLLEHLMGRSGSSPLLIVGTERPEFLDHDGGLATQSPAACRSSAVERATLPLDAALIRV